MKKILALLTAACGLSFAVSSAAQASVRNLSCAMTSELRQMTDYKKPLRPYRVSYTITERGWKTPFPAGWYNRGIFIRREDSITGTALTYAIPNNSDHFIKSGKNFAWSKNYSRGYLTEDGRRQFTFTFAGNDISVSDTDAMLKKTIIGTCVKGQ